jgi:hypothetical protein
MRHSLLLIASFIAACSSSPVDDGDPGAAAAAGAALSADSSGIQLTFVPSIDIDMPLDEQTHDEYMQGSIENVGEHAWQITVPRILFVAGGETIITVGRDEAEDQLGLAIFFQQTGTNSWQRLQCPVYGTTWPSTIDQGIDGGFWSIPWPPQESSLKDCGVDGTAADYRFAAYAFPYASLKNGKYYNFDAYLEGAPH